MQARSSCSCIAIGLTMFSKLVSVQSSMIVVMPKSIGSVDGEPFHKKQHVCQCSFVIYPDPDSRLSNVSLLNAPFIVTFSDLSLFLLTLALIHFVFIFGHLCNFYLRRCQLYGLEIVKYSCKLSPYVLKESDFTRIPLFVFPFFLSFVILVIS